MTTAVATPDPDEPESDFERILKRRAKVMFLRNGGVTWAAISKEVGVSEPTARKDYAAVCRDINAEQPADVVARHRAVIFDVQRANYPRMMSGDKDAAATILRALEREAKLLGLDSPTRILATVSNEDFASEAARLITNIAQIDSATLKELSRGHTPDLEIIDAETEDIPDAEQPTEAEPAERVARDPASVDADSPVVLDEADQRAPVKPRRRGGGARVNPFAGKRSKPAPNAADSPSGEGPAGPAVPADGHTGAADEQPDRRADDDPDGGAGDLDGDDDWSNI